MVVVWNFENLRALYLEFWLLLMLLFSFLCQALVLLILATAMGVESSSSKQNIYATNLFHNPKRHHAKLENLRRRSRHQLAKSDEGGTTQMLEHWRIFIFFFLWDF